MMYQLVAGGWLVVALAIPLLIYAENQNYKLRKYKSRWMKKKLK